MGTLQIPEQWNRNGLEEFNPRRKIKKALREKRSQRNTGARRRNPSVPRKDIVVNTGAVPLLPSLLRRILLII
jgi:hypothetical protein